MALPTEHGFDFDPTHGYGLEQLRAVRPPPEPAGFAVFWRRRHKRARRVDPAPTLSDSPLQHPDWHVFDLRYTSTDGVEIRGWLLRPAVGAIKRGLVVGHGYGGRDAPDFDLPVAETALIFPCARGLSRSACPSIPAEASGHVLHGIESPDDYVIAGCVDDLWLAVSALLALHPAITGRVGYSGISFGGGIGALALPWDDRIDRGFLEVPTFGHRPLWLTLPATGSATAVQAYAAEHPEVADTLRLFDAAIAATRIRQPMLVAPARFDPAVAPPCQFAVANALNSSIHHETFILDAGHAEYPDAAMQHAALARAKERFFRAP